MSKIEVNEIRPQCGTTVTLGGSGETVTVAAPTVNLGACGGTVALTAGASATGFGAITWCTTAKTAAFCAAAGSGYLVNTTSTAFTATLPASPTVGDQIAFVDFAGTFDSNALTLGRNSKKIKSECKCGDLSTERGAVTVIYTGTVQGWITTGQANAETIGFPTYITATGGSPSTGAVSGDYKIHSFTGDGNFCVSSIGNASGSSIVDYLVVGGGAGGGGSEGGGGGGAGGYRESVPSPAAWTASPIASAGGGLTATVSCYAITVGAAGPAGTPTANGGSGTVSTFSTITSAGGGGGGQFDAAGAVGGSGGGGGGRSNYAGGAGDTPNVTPDQGFPGGNAKPCGANPDLGGGGGGALAVGTQGGASPNPTGAGPGGPGGTTCISATPTAYAGGGGGGKDSDSPNSAPAGAGGTGGGGRGASADPGSLQTAETGTINTGGGGGGAGGTPGCRISKAGGSGIVILRYKFQ